MSHDQSCDIFAPLLLEMESELGAKSQKEGRSYRTHGLYPGYFKESREDATLLVELITTDI